MPLVLDLCTIGGIMKSMKAVQIHSYKNPKDFAPREVPIPQVNSENILVKIEFAGVNPSDLANTQGAFPITLLCHELLAETL